MTPRVQYRILETKAFVLYATPRGLEPNGDFDYRKHAQLLRARHRGTGIEVRRFVRRVRAGGAVIKFGVVVARVRLTREPFTEGQPVVPIAPALAADLHALGRGLGRMLVAHTKEARTR